MSRESVDVVLDPAQLTQKQRTWLYRTRIPLRSIDFAPALAWPYHASGLARFKLATSAFMLAASAGTLEVGTAPLTFAVMLTSQCHHVDTTPAQVLSVRRHLAANLEAVAVANWQDMSEYLLVRSALL